MIKRTRKTEAVGDLIRNYAKSTGNENAYLQAKIINNWSEIAGQTINKVTVKLYFNQYALFIKVQSPTVKNELIILKQALIKKINTFVAKEIVNDLVFI